MWAGGRGLVRGVRSRAWIPLRVIRVDTGRRPTGCPARVESPAQHAGSSTRPCDMECVNLAHQGHVLPRDRQCLVVGRRARECQDPAWPNDGQVVGSVDPRVALSHPAWVRAPAQPSCSHVSGPIWAGSPVRAGSAACAGALPPHTVVAASITGCVHSESWFGCPSNGSALSGVN